MEYHLRVILLWCVVFAVVALSMSGLFCSLLEGIFEPAACDPVRGTVRSVASWIRD